MTDGFGNEPLDPRNGEDRLRGDWLREISDDEPGVDLSAPETDEEDWQETTDQVSVPLTHGSKGPETAETIPETIDEGDTPDLTDLAPLSNLQEEGPASEPVDVPELSGLPELGDLAESDGQMPEPEEEPEEDPWFSQLPGESEYKTGSVLETDADSFRNPIAAPEPVPAREPEEKPEEEPWLSQFPGAPEEEPKTVPETDADEIQAVINEAESVSEPIRDRGEEAAATETDSADSNEAPWLSENAEDPKTETEQGTQAELIPEPKAAPAETSPLDGIPWLRDLADPDDEQENALVAAKPAAPTTRETVPPVPARQTDVPAEEFPEIPLPPREKKGSARNHRTFAEWRRNHKKVLKTPDYYDGAGKNESFRVNYDFALAYKNPVRHLAIRRSTVRHTGWLGGLMYVVFILCISVAAAAGLWLAASDVLALGKEDGIVEVTVPDDFTVDDVADILFSQGLIRYRKLFGFYGELSHAEDTIDPGTYQLHRNFDYRALVYGMSEDDGEMIEVEVTVPEGYTLDQIAALLEDKGVCSVSKFMAAAADTEFDYDFLEGIPTGDAYRLEGYLFPDTYKFYLNDDPERVIDKFLTDFDIRFSDEMLGRAQSMGLSIREILTIASIIEKEAGDDSERADVSSVIYNRLASDEYSMLGMDSTVYYAASRMGTEFNTGLDSPYNTYRVVGLPAGPIASPGLRSIEAALYPNETEYLFFAVDVEGKTRFFETMSEFEEFTASEEFGG